jgi:hypothetical protein
MAQINKPTDYFNTVLYAGDNSTSNAITGVGFQPDLVWIKNRSAASSQLFQDSVRGKSGSNYLYLQANDTAAEAAQGDDDGLNTIASDGFTVGYTNSVGWNASGNNYASWNWLGGGTASSNTDGSITSSVSASTTSGFSIVSYTGNGTNGASIGHGLGTTPAFWILKNRSSGTNQKWIIGHKSLSNATDKYMDFSTAAEQTASGIFGIGSSTLTFTTSYDATNMSGETCIGYFFAEKKGFSKFGSYTGNGSTDGTFVYTGFKPAFIIAKETNEAGDNWVMFDNKRDGYNVNNDELYPNLSNAEADGATFVYVDLLSNGFKWRTTASNKNQSGSTYIYMCFAENPLVGTNNIPATAR